MSQCLGRTCGTGRRKIYPKAFQISSALRIQCCDNGGLRSKKSIAFCISGQIRSFEALKNINKEINKIRNYFYIKIFISTWNKKGIVDSNHWRRKGKLKRIFEEKLVPYLPEIWLNENVIWKYLPKNKARIDSELLTKITKEKILEKIDADFIDIEEEEMDLNFDENHERFQKDRSSIKMYYKGWRCNELKKQFEKKNNIFDFVIGCRPDIDISFKSDFMDIELKDKIIFCKTFPEMKNYLDDSIRLTNSHTSDILSSIFSKTIEYPNNWEGTHKELYLYCKNLNIKNFPIQDLIHLSRIKVDKNNLIKYEDLILDYPELKYAFLDPKEVNNLSFPLQKIAKGYHIKTKKFREKK